MAHGPLVFSASTGLQCLKLLGVQCLNLKHDGWSTDIFWANLPHAGLKISNECSKKVRRVKYLGAHYNVTVNLCMLTCQLMPSFLIVLATVIRVFVTSSVCVSCFFLTKFSVKIR